MKKRLSLFVWSFLITFSAFARDFTYTHEGQTLTYTVLDEEAKTCKTKSGNEVIGDLIIPSVVSDGNTDYNVTTIGLNTFYGCADLTSVTIPNSVITIGSDAFRGCTGLTSMTIPNSVTTICAYAFEYCTGLTSVTIGNSVNTIGKDAFFRCNDIKELIIEDGETELSLSPNAFSNCPLETLYLGRHLKYEEASPFYQKTTLSKVVIGNSVTTIGKDAFRGCTGLTSVTIPNSVTTIGAYAFVYCTGLTSVTIPNSVTTIGGGAFGHCTGLTSVTIPNSVTTIGGVAFGYCTGLTSVTIPNSVTTIGAYAFEYCTGIKELIIEDGETELSLAYHIFSNCPFETLYLGRDLKYQILFSIDFYSPFYQKTALSKVEIGNSVTTIGKLAFNGCTGLTSVTIPNSVTTIGEYAFKNIKLTELTCMATMPPSAYSNSFDDDTYQTARLTINSNSAASYKNHEVWGKFDNVNCTIQVESITLDSDRHEVKEGSQVQITATIFPVNATNKSLVWFSSDETVATVDPSGLVSVLKVGNCVISAKTTDGSDLIAEFQLDCLTAIDSIMNTQEEEVKVFNLKGNLVSNTLENLAPGIYIVRKGNKVQKIAVK